MCAYAAVGGRREEGRRVTKAAEENVVVCERQMTRWCSAWITFVYAAKKPPSS